MDEVKERIEERLRHMYLGDIYDLGRKSAYEDVLKMIGKVESEGTVDGTK